MATPYQYSRVFRNIVMWCQYSVLRFIYICLCTTHVQTHTHAHTYIGVLHTYKHTPTHTRTHLCVCMCVCINIHMHARKHTQSFATTDDYLTPHSKKKKEGLKKNLKAAPSRWAKWMPSVVLRNCPQICETPPPPLFFFQSLLWFFSTESIRYHLLLPPHIHL